MPAKQTKVDLLHSQVIVFVPHLGYRQGRVVQAVNHMVLVKFDDQLADWYHVRQVRLA